MKPSLQRYAVVQLVKRNVFAKEDLWRIVYCRYGSLNSFNLIERTYNQISSILRLHYQTVRGVLKRFERDGFQVFMRRKLNESRPTKLPYEVAQ